MNRNQINIYNTTGLAGDNDLQNAEIGSIADFIVDIGRSCENVMKETDEAKKVLIFIYIYVVTYIPHTVMFPLHPFNLTLSFNYIIFL